MPRGYRGDGQVIAAWVPEELANRLRAVSKAEELSMSWLARRAIREYLERIEAATAA